MKNNNSSNKIAKILSLRKTPWDKKINKTPLESFIRNHNKKTYEEDIQNYLIPTNMRF